MHRFMVRARNLFFACTVIGHQVLSPKLAVGADTPESAPQQSPIARPVDPPGLLSTDAVASPPEPPAAADLPGVYVHIESDGAVDLERYTILYFSSDYLPVCTAPCNAFLPSSGQYRIAGSNVRPSMPFALRGRRANLRVAPAWNSTYRAGAFMAALGAVDVGILGSVLLAAGVVAFTAGRMEDGHGFRRFVVRRNE